MKARLFISIFFLLLLSVSVLAQTAPSGDTAIMNQIREQLERNKAEIIKAVRDAQNASMNSTQTFIDQNFEVLDNRIQEFNKGLKRDIAVIMIATFLVGFALSQVLKIRIESSRRKGLITRTLELESAVEKLTKEATDLTAKVRQLKALDDNYSKELKSFTRKPSFLTIGGIILAIIAFCAGILIPLLLKVKIGG